MSVIVLDVPEPTVDDRGDEGIIIDTKRVDICVRTMSFFQIKPSVGQSSSQRMNEKDKQNG